MTPLTDLSEQLADNMAEKLQTLLSGLQDVDLPAHLLPFVEAASKALDGWHRHVLDQIPDAPRQ